MSKTKVVKNSNEAGGKHSIKKVVVLPDIRSAYNIGSIFRTCDAVGIDEIVLSGCTPRPLDKFNRVQKEIAKTALAQKKIFLGHMKKIPRKRCKN